MNKPVHLAPPIRVLHCPDVVGGHAPQLARAERTLGVEARSVTLQASPYGYAPDEVLSRPGASALGRELKRWPLLWRALRDFDVVHFNFGSSIFPSRGYAQPGASGVAGGGRALLANIYRHTLSMRDLPLLKKAGKAIFVTYQGDDARQGDYCRAHFDVHFVHEVGPEYYPEGSDDQKRRAIATFAGYADGIYALNPDLLYVLPAHAKFLPYASVDPKDWRPAPETRQPHDPLTIVHAPSHRLVKGTRYLTEAVERLKTDGLALELILVENLPRTAARKLYERADLVVDQLLAGWYGGLGVEAMALGKPVVAYLREADLKFIPKAMRDDLPVINASALNIYDVLKSLATTRRRSLREIGMRGRRYLEMWHDPIKIAAAVIEDYRAALAYRDQSHGRDRTA